MINVRKYDDTLRKIAVQFFVSDLYYVSDLSAWSKERGVGLSEPSQPMKLIPEGTRLMMFVQAEVSDGALDNIMRALSVRSSLKDNVYDPSTALNSDKKRLAYCFLKEYARSVQGVAGHELREDEWTMREMEKLGFFRE